MTDLFDIRARVHRRDRAARAGVELFVYERLFADCLERIAMIGRTFDRALLIGSPDPQWPARLRERAEDVEVLDPGPQFAKRAGGEAIIEDDWAPPSNRYDLVLAVGTLDSANHLPLALRLIHHAMRADGLFIGVLPGGNTLPQLRAAMRAADGITGAAAPHVHPRIDASALAPLLAESGFIRSVVDVDRVPVAYPGFVRLVTDLRRMGVTNILSARPRFVGKAARCEAIRTFRAAGNGSHTIETFELLHFAAWTPAKS